MQQQVANEQAIDRMRDSSNGRMDETTEDAKTFVDFDFRHSTRVRRGAIVGAMLGMVVGLIPLLTAVICSTIAGALIARASEMHIERGSKPRVHFGRVVTAQAGQHEN